jgi:superfamily II DNA or RNA helicase
VDEATLVFLNIYSKIITMAEDKPSRREYQLEMLEAAKKENIIVCLGTGTGKTFISIKLIAYLAQVDDIRQPFSEGAKRTIFLVNTGEFILSF